jgi:hypothetical protein
VLLIFVSLLLVFTGCNRNPPSPPETPPVDDSPKSVDIHPLVPLLPRLQTHYAVDSKGNLYWLQESEPPAAGGDLVFVMGVDGVPQTIEDLSVTNLLDKLGLHGAKGAIRSLAIGPDDALNLLFVGSRGADPIYFVAQYIRATRSVRMAIDTAQLMRDSEMGASIELARGSLLSSSTDLWLWLRHTDAFALLNLHNQTAGVTIARRLDVTPPAGVQKWRLNDESESLSAGPNGMLFFLDRAHVTLWQIDAKGQVASVMSLAGMPQSITPPIEINNRLFMLAGPSPRFRKAGSAYEQDEAPEVFAHDALPAMLAYSLTDGTSTWFYRDHLHGPESLPLQTLDPRQLKADLSSGTLVTFDAGSGEMLRLRFSGQ